MNPAAADIGLYNIMLNFSAGTAFATYGFTVQVYPATPYSSYVTNMTCATDIWPFYFVSNSDTGTMVNGADIDSTGSFMTLCGAT